MASARQQPVNNDYDEGFPMGSVERIVGQQPEGNDISMEAEES